MTNNDYFLVSMPLIAAILVASFAWFAAQAAVRRSKKVYRPAQQAAEAPMGETKVTTVPKGTFSNQWVGALRAQETGLFVFDMVNVGGKDVPRPYGGASERTRSAPSKPRPRKIVTTSKKV